MSISGHHKMGTCYRDTAIAAAKDLLYGEEVIEKVKNAKDDVEIEYIMRCCRLGISIDVRKRMICK